MKQLLDYIALALGRKKSFYSFGKVFLIDRGTVTLNGETKQMTMIGGVLAGDLRETEDNEIWEGEVIFIPKRRLVDTEKTQMMKGTLDSIVTRNLTQEQLNEEFKIVGN